MATMLLAVKERPMVRLLLLCPDSEKSPEKSEHRTTTDLRSFLLCSSEGMMLKAGPTFMSYLLRYSTWIRSVFCMRRKQWTAGGLV